MFYQFLFENQFVQPDSEESELIFPAPLPDGKAGFKDGVNRKNQFED